VSKIEFLLMIISVFVAVSYLPVRSEATKVMPGRPLRYQRDA
jgi:hypothetical protein